MEPVSVVECSQLQSWIQVFIGRFANFFKIKNKELACSAERQCPYSRGLIGDAKEKIEIRKKVQRLEVKREGAWKEYDEAPKEIENQKDGLIDKVESRLEQGTKETTLFKIRWSLTEYKPDAQASE